jgi:hypothetical protein
MDHEIFNFNNILTISNKKNMKKIKLLLFALIVILFTTPMFSQGFTPPANSNAVVYFVRVSSYGGAVSFEYFHNKEFIGKFKGKNYMRYECPEGEQLLWASSEDKEFLKCDLKAGETYLVLVNIQMGAWKARVDLEPLTSESENFERAKSLVNKKAPIVTSQAIIQSTQKKLEKRGFVENIMEKYENEWKNAKNTKTISPEMYIPKAKLK